MNASRLAITALAATFVDMLYGFVVYGNVLAGQFTALPAVFRSEETGPAYLPGMFVGILVAMFVVSYIYAKGYEGGGGLSEGVRFGLLMGIFNAAYVVGVNYAILNITSGLALSMALAGFGEWLLIGATVGVVSRPPVRVAKAVRV